MIAAERLDYPGGPLPLDSPLYILRPPLEARAEQELARSGCVLRIRGAQGTGKSSLALRLLAIAQQQGDATAVIDMRQMSATSLASANQFLRTICHKISRQLGREPKLDDYWDDEVGSKLSCTYYLEEHILSTLDRPLLLKFRNFNQIFRYPELVQEVLPLLRSWYEEAKFSETWRKLKLILAYQTEAFLQLPTHQSPFNIGLPLALPSFTLAQVSELAQRYGTETQPPQLAELTELTGGRPLLVTLALYHAIQAGQDTEAYWRKFVATAATEAGIYRNHLRRYWQILADEPELAAAWQAVLASDRPVDLDPVMAYQLEGLGLVTLAGCQASVSCGLYRRYFQQYWAADGSTSQVATPVVENSNGNGSLSTAAAAELDSLAQLQRENLTLRQLSGIDPLTQLANRGRFDEKLQSYWQQSLEEGFPITLILCDVDCFKRYNDTFGHVAGDESLRQVARVLQLNISPPFYLAARYGGEEFAILLPGADVVQGEVMAEHLRSQIAALNIPVAGEGIEVGGFPADVLTASLGVASAIATPDETPSNLIEAADRALYQAKRTGRNVVCVSTEPGFNVLHLRD